MSTSTGNQGDPCDWLGGPCNEGLFCNAPGCTAGSCQPTLTPEQQQQHLDAQCGCDGISYFNPSVAESKAMSLAHPGPCGENEAIACDKMTPCPGDLHCNLRIQNLSQCFFSPGAKFTCWAVPNECDPKSALGHSCASVLPNDCDDICSLIKSKDAWYEDIGCK